MPSTTARDIAKKLGISTASVSVALNGKPGVSQATRDKVLAAARELGYNISRNATAEKKVLCFLIYVDQIVGIAQETTFYTFVLKGVEAAAKALGYCILIRYYYANRSFDDVDSRDGFNCLQALGGRPLYRRKIYALPHCYN